MITDTDKDAIEHYHDHDAEAEDRPAPEQHWTEIDLADVIIGKTIIEYKGATADNAEFKDHNWQTRRESNHYPTYTTERWIDATPHETALDAIEAADLYMHYSERLTSAEMELHAANLHAQSALTKIGLARKEQS